MGCYQRRRFVVAAGALFCAPLALAQAARIWRVGLINSGGHLAYVDEFPKGMRELGYEVGKNLVIESRFADGRFDRCPALVAELLIKKPDVIVVGGTPAVEAVKRATSTVPVVMTTVGNPVASGFVASLARPGGNITGLSLDNADVAAKWFELARSVAPKARIGVIANPNQRTNPGYARSIQDAAQSVGVKVPVVTARTDNEIDDAFEALARERVTTVIVLPNGLFNVNVERIAGLALKHRMASIGTTRSYAEGGVLLSYGQDYGAFMRKAAVYVDKIFKGAKPGELPIEQPLILELTVNLATAKKLGLAIPKEIVARADTVIE